MLVSKFSQAYLLITPIRMMSMQQYQMSGEWPTKLKQIGMGEEDTSDGQYIDKIRLGNKGEIIALLSKKIRKQTSVKTFAKIHYGWHEYSLAVLYKLARKTD